MQGDKKVIKFLNQILKTQLTAINQYFLHARIFKNWGLKELNEHEYHESIVEMKNGDKLIERILFLEGLPNLQDLGKLYIGENTQEILECDLKLDTESLPLLKDAIAYCESVKDYVTRDLLTSVLDSEEEHIDWLEAQLGLIEKLGLANYQQSMIED